jgi:hypothetical protein
MNQQWTFEIAGCFCPMAALETILGELQQSCPAFRCRVSRIRAHCPLRHQDSCSACEGRPFLGRAYGLPIDAYAVETDEVIVVRSLCHLYNGLELHDIVSGKDLKQHLAHLSNRLGGGKHWGRFTSIEATLARARRSSNVHT